VRASGGQRGWRIDRLVSTLRIDDGESQLAECWTILAVQPLDEVLVELDVDPPPGVHALPELLAGGATVDVTYGGELLGETWPASAAGRPVVVVRLPGPLEPRQRHDFRLSLTLPLGPDPAALPRRHVHVPPVPCRELVMRVRFADPRWRSRMRQAPVWLVESMAPRELDGAVTPPPLSTLLTLDPVGELRVTFRSPIPGLAYGIQWSPRAVPCPG
jgi:hypothetical protein